ncbi:MAG: hypothetical protein GY943_36410 [Chloroflexi bacterium]|nr:hypothetical protein [Chloroflexota bacterium]
MADPVADPPEPDLVGYSYLILFLRAQKRLLLSFLVYCKTAVSQALVDTKITLVHPKETTPVSVIPKRVKNKEQCPQSC